MEQVFFRLHVRAVHIGRNILGQKAVFLLEKIYLLNAFCLLGLLVSLHMTFVNQPPENLCLAHLLGDKIKDLHKVDVIQFHVSHEPYNSIEYVKQPSCSSDLMSTNCLAAELSTAPVETRQVDSSRKHRQLIFEKFVDMIGLHYDDSPRTRGKLSLDAYAYGSSSLGLPFTNWQGMPPENVLSWVDRLRSWTQRRQGIDRDTEPFPDKLSRDEKQSVPHTKSDSESGSQFWKALAEAQLFDKFMADRVYLYSREKGFLMLRSEVRAKHNVSRIDVSVPKDSVCFGSGPLSWLVHNLIGYDTVIMNWIISYLGGKGYLYNVYSKELYNLNLATEFRESTGGANGVLMFKVGILFTTLFLFFTTTTLVSFTLRETQERMLKFTYLLQHHVRNNLPYAPLVLTHVVESLVFVPIMVGILFFLFEFFSDQLLAFMVLLLVWLAEVFSVVSVRTLHSVRLFPRLFFLYFCIFHFYFFSFPFGFSYVALFTTVMFLQHSLLFCWNHYEVPALVTGRVSAIRPRSTSSALPWIPQGNTVTHVATVHVHAVSSSVQPGGGDAAATPSASPRSSTSAPMVPPSPSLGIPVSAHVQMSRDIQRRQMQSSVPVPVPTLPLPLRHEPASANISSGVPTSPGRNAWARFLGLGPTQAHGTTVQSSFVQPPEVPFPVMNAPVSPEATGPSSASESEYSLDSSPRRSLAGPPQSMDTGWEEYLPLDEDAPDEDTRTYSGFNKRRRVHPLRGTAGGEIEDNVTDMRSSSISIRDARTGAAESCGPSIQRGRSKTSNREGRMRDRDPSRFTVFGPVHDDDIGYG